MEGDDDSFEGLRLYCDHREQKIVPFITCPIKVIQLTIGDYMIGSRNQILAVFERKTLADYGASIKDGRTANLDKLLQYRRDKGCDVYYIIEGPAFPAATTKYAGIPYANIASSIRNLQVRHGVFVIRTANEGHTANELASFLRSYETPPTGSVVTGSAERCTRFPWTPELRLFVYGPEPGQCCDVTLVRAIIEEKCGFSAETLVVEGRPANPYHDQQAVIEHITTRPAESLASQVRTCYFQLPGFGEKSSIAAMKYPMRYYITELIPAPPHTTLNVAQLTVLYGMRVANDGTNAHSAKGRENSIKWVSGITGISATAAQSLMNTVGYLPGLMQHTEATLANVKIVRRAGSRPNAIGPALAKKIIEIVNFKMDI